MPDLSRRALLAGSAGLLALPRTAAAEQDADQRLRALLDDAARDRDGTIAALDRIDPTALSPSARIDRATARAGLAIDAELDRHFPSARPDRRLPLAPADARACYTLLLRRAVGDDADPDALRRRLEAEQARTLAQADRLFRRIGRRGGTVGARYTDLWHDERWLYQDSDAGRDRAVADMNRVLDRARSGLDMLFGPLPPEVRNVATQRMPPAEEAAGRQGYRLLPEGARAGAYVVDLREIRRRPAWTLPAVVQHELLPGHMVQLPIEARAHPHPLRLEYASAFAEGWAIYAEQLASGGNDTLAALGRCHWRLFRIGRARADIGLHLDGWSSEMVLSHWRETMGEPAYFAPFATDLARLRKEPASRAAEAAVAFALTDGARGRQLRDWHRIVLAHGRKRTDLLQTMRAGAA